jgi:hypothetical protein
LVFGSWEVWKRFEILDWNRLRTGIVQYTSPVVGPNEMNLLD